MSTPAIGLARRAEFGAAGPVPDALLVVGFGGPEHPDEVMPFLHRVTAGRDIPDERLRVVGQHYFDRGGVSPINELCRDMIGRITVAFERADVGLAIYWGNRNAAPFLDEALAQMADDGIERALAFVTSAYGSYSACRQYRENVAKAAASVGSRAPVIEKLRVYYDHPGFVEPLVDGLELALAAGHGGVDTGRTQVLFSAHSIPMSMAATSSYVEQVKAAAELIAARVADMPDWQVVWQSRSGPPAMPWLEPDIVDVVEALDRDLTDRIVVVPVGFVSDHMEVIQDLDTDTAMAAAAGGLAFARVPTSGTDPRFIDMVGDLVRECTEGKAAAEPKALAGSHRLQHWCDQRCCPAPGPGPAASSPGRGL